MSLILDALNRADTERKNQTPVPDLNTLHRPLALEPNTASRSWLWWGAGAVTFLLIAISFWRWLAISVAPASVEIPAASVSAVPVSAAPISVNMPPATQAVVNQTKETRVNTPISSLQTSVSQSVTTLASAVAIKPDNLKATTDVKNLYAEDTAPEVPIDADVNQLYAVEESTGSESVVDPFSGVPMTQASQSSSEVLRESSRTFENSGHIQDFNDLPWNTKQKMPTISYQRHDYLVGGISSVVINGQTVGVGNIVATGQFVVQDILVDGVVLKHGDRVFKLRALNGWINM